MRVYPFLQAAVRHVGVFLFTTSSVNVWVYRFPPHAMGMCRVYLFSTATTVEVQGVSMYMVFCVAMQGVSINSPCSVDMKVVSLSTSSSVDVQG
jgi:hypothetical protein